MATAVAEAMAVKNRRRQGCGGQECAKAMAVKNRRRQGYGGREPPSPGVWRSRTAVAEAMAVKMVLRGESGWQNHLAQLHKKFAQGAEGLKDITTETAP